jgi:gamma-glutamyl-gamma-aminobutyrate hydrolase PuuD
VASSGSDAASQRRPRIGLTTYLERAQCFAWDTQFALLPMTYVEAIAAAGATPVLLPPVKDGDDDPGTWLDGLVFSGGADIDPSRYGEQPHPETWNTRPWRDEWELRLLHRALDADLPVLGVCRGVQLLNVALGGSLLQHVPDAVRHDAHRPGPGVFGSTRVQLRDGSRLARTLGPNVTARCHHHQALARVAAELDAVGWADDGTVEAVEMRGRRFVVGVQWHPEEDVTVPALFDAFVSAAREGAPAHPHVVAVR